MVGSRRLRLRRDYEEAGHYEQNNDSGLPPGRGLPGWERMTGDAGTTQYLPQRRQPPMLGEGVAGSATGLYIYIYRPRWFHAWQQPTEAHLERTSAEDRAKGGWWPRRCWCWSPAGGGRSDHGGVGRGGDCAVRVTFLAADGRRRWRLYMWDSRTEYAHSRGGIERLRIVESADLDGALTASWSFGAWRWRPISICTAESNRE